MPKKPSKSAAAGTSGEHIFPASQLTPLAVQWKELNAAGQHKEAMFVLEQIVVLSTAMFERMAQYEEYHRTVDLPVLVSAAQEKVVRWLMRWQPQRGRLFSWFSTCAKNAFRSELAKVTQYRKRYHVTSDNLEKFHGIEDHEVDKHDLANDVHAQIHGMTCAWGDPQEIGALKYAIRCIIDDDAPDKQSSIRGAAYAYGISFELSRFFYDWAMAALRNTLYERAYIPFTEQELLLACESYTLLPLVNATIGFEATRKLIVLLDGKRLKLPPIAGVRKMVEDERLHREIDRSDLSPDAIAEIARKHHKTERSAQETYIRMSEMLDPRRYGEHDIFGENPLDSA